MRELIFETSSNESPSLFITPGRKFSTNTSLFSISFFKKTRSTLFFKFLCSLHGIGSITISSSYEHCRASPTDMAEMPDAAPLSYLGTFIDNRTIVSLIIHFRITFSASSNTRTVSKPFRPSETGPFRSRQHSRKCSSSRRNGWALPSNRISSPRS